MPTMVDTRTLAKVVHDLRIQQGLSKTQAAQRAGVGKSTWEAAEKGSHRDGTVFNPSEVTLAKIARGLGVPPRQIFEAAGIGGYIPEDDSDLQHYLEEIRAELQRELDERFNQLREDLRRRGL